MKNYFFIQVMLLAFTVFFLPHCEKREVNPTKTEATTTRGGSGRVLSSGSEITLKDGELYEISGGKIGNQITSTGGKISPFFLLSPDKHYVAYSILVGIYNVVGLDDDVGELRDVHHIVVMDLNHKKQLMEIKPQSETEPFLDEFSWISNDELLITESDGFATGKRYIYQASNNELRLE